MAAETASGHLGDDGHELDDGPGPREWLRIHRFYCASLVAIVMATLFGAQWAGQPGGEMGTMSSTPSVVQEAPAPTSN